MNYEDILVKKRNFDNLLQNINSHKVLKIVYT